MNKENTSQNQPISNKVRPALDTKNFITSAIGNIKQQVGTDNVLCALSGGVDSTVLAVLLNKAIGEQLVCFHVDSGLMRANESATIIRIFKENFNIDVKLINGQNDFFTQLKGIIEPEQKRKIIGKLYIELFEKAANQLKNCKWLAQGTIWPDVLESQSEKGIVKSHHNVGGLPEKMNLKVLEPLRELYKNEVRIVGKELGIPTNFIYRHPFPGPGLGVRVLGEITQEKIIILQKADAILIDELHKSQLYNTIWQAFVVLLPIKSVGVREGQRTYEYACVVRAINSVDAMTAEWHKIPYEVLDKISIRICGEVTGINRVVYDITNKPPATIEWE